MTPTERDDLRRLAGSATAGPWKLHRPKSNRIEDAGNFYVAETGPYDASGNTAAFIAAANPQTVLRLLDEIDALSKGLEHLSGVSRNFMRRFNPNNMPEGDAQQWEALNRELDLADALTTSSKESGDA